MADEILTPEQVADVFGWIALLLPDRPSYARACLDEVRGSYEALRAERDRLREQLGAANAEAAVKTILSGAEGVRP